MYLKIFASSNDKINKVKKKISNKYLGFYGINSINCSNEDIKIYVLNINKIPSKTKQDISNMAKDIPINYIANKVKNPTEFHMEYVVDMEINK